MKKIYFLSLSAVFLAGCVFLSPYTITFTTPDELVIQPETYTLDLALNDPALVYISSYKCGEDDTVEILPVVTDSMLESNVHNLSLSMLSDVEAGALCKVNVTAFDRTTTATSSDSINLYVRMKPEPNYSEEITACGEAGGEWNQCGSACGDDDEICIQVCVPKCEFPDEQAPEPSTDPETEESEA